MDRSTVVTGLTGIAATFLVGPQIVEILDWFVQLHWGIPIPTKPAAALSNLINIGIMWFVLHRTKDKPVKIDGEVIDAKGRDKILTEAERAKLRTKLEPEPEADKQDGQGTSR